MTGRKMVTAARLRHVHAGPDASRLFAEVTDGPAVAAGRSLQLYLDDSEVRELLATLALTPRWAPAIIALADCPHVSNAAAGARSLNAAGTQRQALTLLMEEAVRQPEITEQETPS